ncbi:MAG: hypothetical protein WBS20_14130 [Lysobacterales bacterium]
MNASENRNEVSGLCMTCNHAAFCIYLASASRSIWSCEEFDDRPPIIEPKKTVRTKRAARILETKYESAPYAERQMRKVS